MFAESQVHLTQPLAVKTYVPLAASKGESNESALTDELQAAGEDEKCQITFTKIIKAYNIPQLGGLELDKRARTDELKKIIKP